MKRFVLRSAALAAVFSTLSAGSLYAQPPGVAPAESQPAVAEPGRVFITSLQDEQPGRVTLETLDDTQPTSVDDVLTPDLPEVNDPTLPEVTVTAQPFPAQPLNNNVVLSESRSVTALASTGSSITVLTQDDFQNRGARTLSDALRSVPGLDVRVSGGAGHQTTIFTRGTNGSHTKVLLDGIPLNDPASPARAFNPANFMLGNVERIEVIRGSQSAIYGSDAIGGVINIVTKRGDGEPSLTTTFEGGSFGTFRQSTSVSGGDDRHWFSFAGDWFQTDGFSAFAGGSENDGYENGTLSGRAGMFVTDNLDVDVVWRYQDSDSDFDGFLADGPNNLDNEEFFLRLQAHLTQLDGNLEHTVGYNLTSYKRDDLMGSQAFFDGVARRFDYQSTLRLFEEDGYTHSIVAGVDHTREDLFQDVSNPSATWPAFSAQTLNELYVENRMLFWDRLALNAAYRYSDFSRSRDADTYRVSGRYSIDETGAAVHGAVATGFRTPALAEVAAGFGFNPTLVPESSTSWEVGVEQRLFDNRVVLDATYFDIDFDDLINFVFNPSTFSFDAMNVDRASSRGVEVTGEIQLDEHTVLSGAYTWNRARDVGAGTDLLRRPRHKFNLSLGRFLLDRRAYAALNWRFVGHRTDFRGFVIGDVDSYSVLDASAWYQLSDNVRLFTRIDNLTDADYQDVFGFNTAQLSAYGGVTVTWGGGE
ncbi:MAG: TonB-dependent receptor plug domain-containing protein [Planctomycetota bacterium]|jgi:vitamin B12 transporter